MPVTLQDIAKAADVSVSTVSRVLSNSKHPLNDETRQRILQIAQQMGYTPNLLARSLRKEQSFSVGIVVDNIDSIFAPQIIRGIQDTLKPARYTCLIINSDWDRSQEEASVRELISRSADGLIFVDTWLHPANIPAENISIPCLYVNRIFNSGNSIGPDDQYGARLAVEHLARLGHRRIAFIGGPEGWDASRARLLGYQSVVREQGLVFKPEYIEVGDWDIPSSYEATTRLLALAERPTAIFAANDVMALGTIYALQDAELKIPGDMALVGYDDQDFSSFSNPTLTTITLPAYEMGRKAGELLLQQLGGAADTAKPQLVKGELTIRESCGDPRGQGMVKTAQRPNHSPRVVPTLSITRETHSVISTEPQKLTPVSFQKVVIDDAFWSPRQITNRTRTIQAIYGKLQEIGYIDALKLEWRPGMPKEPHIFWESDLAKWIEAVSYTLATYPDPELDALLDQIIALLASAQQPDGYLNAHFTVVEPDKRWANLRDWHELYCAGHLIEAAVAHYQATGKRSLLDVMCRYADYIESVFGTEPGKKRGYPGHEEIELALVKLYRATGEERYLRLAQYFVEERGQQPHYYDIEARQRGEDPADFWAKTYEYNQSHKPLRQQDQAVGHAVRAMYLYCAAADLVYETGDAELLRVCERLYESVVERQMYVTGSIGPGRHNEGFTRDYDLPNDTTYAETCAAIGLFLWMHRMVHIDGDGRYSDVMERALYNGILSGISLDGQRYFYENPLAVDRQNEGFRRKPHHRQSWYGTACCPPNITRLLASLGGYIYSQSETDAVVHLYVQGRGEIQVAGQAVTLVQETNYPWDGAITIRVQPEQPARFGLRLRIPGWCHQATVQVNGETWSAQPERGYVRLERLWTASDTVTLSLSMPVERVYAHPKVKADRGRVTLQRGPVVYCLESADNGGSLDEISLPTTSVLEARYEPELLGGVVSISGEAQRPAAAESIYADHPPAKETVAFKAIPYCFWDNRDSGDMLVWINES
ncbi:MAG: glycoside hydrolase family 127 protein [Anaerolineae bacterium]|nr:glycoside hydrolase family 127 protein [Anaerolineae bacterium]